MAIKMMTLQFVLMREYLSNACRQLLQFTLHHNFNIYVLMMMLLLLLLLLMIMMMVMMRMMIYIRLCSFKCFQHHLATFNFWVLPDRILNSSWHCVIYIIFICINFYLHPHVFVPACIYIFTYLYSYFCIFLSLLPSISIYICLHIFIFCINF